MDDVSFRFISAHNRAQYSTAHGTVMCVRVRLNERQTEKGGGEVGYKRIASFHVVEISSSPYLYGAVHLKRNTSLCNNRCRIHPSITISSCVMHENRDIA